jgi:malonyl CoA-acyl carrier protein transacylase
MAAGAAGVVLDWQLALARESSLPDPVKTRVARMDGSETGTLGGDSVLRYRVYSRVGEAAYGELLHRQELDGIDRSSSAKTLAAWRSIVEQRVRDRQLLLIGQDAAFARPLAESFRTVSGICQAIRREAFRQLRAASQLDPLGENAPLAESHGTRFPILQGPMTRVSDTPEFALAVAQAGALPFLALALMRGNQVAKLVSNTKEMLGALPWGVGVLGFVPKELRDEQLTEVMKYKPPFVIIAGGRPDMAKSYEDQGVHVYLHVPSPELARSFLVAGARRLVFEGRECGGHVGPRSSFVLWEQIVRVMLEHLGAAVPTRKADDYHIVFAGGIHDALSAAMVAALAAPLAERGVRVGLVIGTGYLFTHEAVSSGAITSTFQAEAVACSNTILVESGVGHATRCADSAFGQTFASERRRLLKDGKPKEEIRLALEELNLGRLRIASKGIIRRNDSSNAPVYEQIAPDVIRQEGMFMIGQVAALRQELCSIEALHTDASSGSSVLRARVNSLLLDYRREHEIRDSDIAVVGLSCILPKAGGLDEYWQNILNRRYALEEIPEERWSTQVYFDADRHARDKVYSRWGGFLEDVMFEPVKFGMPPTSLPSIDPLQMLTLEFVRRALADAGYDERKFDRERTCCIVGVGGGVAELGLAYGFRSMLPHYMDRAGGTLADSAALLDRLNGELPEWSEDSFAGLLQNVVAGRVANRFDLGGTNFVVDAACATGLAALRQATTELETHSSNVAIVAAVDTTQSPFGYLCFSKTLALSPTGQPRVFDETADGIVTSEGITVLVLKRLEDAILDGDRVHGVIKAIGASSDGKDKGLTAPRPVGQIRALARAYEKAMFDAETVGLIEAHGTGTVVGDRTEVESLRSYFGKSGTQPRSIALGSVKSMIGHTKCAAGGAGLIKALLATRNRTLPPTIGVTKPSAQANLADSPVFVNTEPRPWLRRLDGASRRAGVNAFGFGGTNFHAVVEEFRGIDGAERDHSAVRDWPEELFLWRGESADQIADSLERVRAVLSSDAPASLAQLAAAVYWDGRTAQGKQCLAVVANSLEELASKIDPAKAAVATGQNYEDPRGVYYSPNAVLNGKIAFVFPGQGSQSVFMMNDLVLAFPEMIDALEEADAALGNSLGRQLSTFIFPPSTFSDADRESNQAALKRTNVAQPALGAVDIATFRLLRRLGIHPDMAGGHSYGEFAALCAAGVFKFGDLIRISELRGRAIVESASSELGTMAAVEAAEEPVSRVLQDIEGVVIANLNGPSQTVISGTDRGVRDAIERLKAKGIRARPIPVACAFHSPLVAGAAPRLRASLDKCELNRPRFPVFSNTTATPHPSEPEAIRDLLSDHLARSVRFNDEVLAMYEAGARVFIECGPGRVLTGLVSGILGGRPCVAVAVDQPGRSGLTQLVHALAKLATAGVPVEAAALFEGRVPQSVDLDQLAKNAGPNSLSSTTWVITNGKAIPASKAKAKNAPKNMVDPQLRKSGQNVLLHVNGTSSNGTSSHVSSSHVSHGNGSNGAAPISDVPIPMPIAPAPAVPIAPPASFASAPASSPIHAMIEGHHRLMTRFLESHRMVMTTYLGQISVNDGSAVGAHDGPPLAPQIKPVVMPTENQVLQIPLAVHDTREVVSKAVSPSASALAAPQSAHPATSPAPETANRESISKFLLQVVSQRTGYPPEMLGLEMDLEADLGIDSIKRVEIISALQEQPFLPISALEGQVESLSTRKTLGSIIEWITSRVLTGNDTAPQPQAQPSVLTIAPSFEKSALQITSSAPAPVSRESISKFLLQVVSQRTGYPPEMLGLEMDLEADLGIDSIKRVEIISALQEQPFLPASALEGQVESLSTRKTLGSIIEWITSRVIAPRDTVSKQRVDLEASPQGFSEANSKSAPARDLAQARGYDQAGKPGEPMPTRMLPKVVDAPITGSKANRQSKRNGTILVISDGSGVAPAVAAILRGMEANYEILTHSAETGSDLLNPARISELVDSRRPVSGAIAACIHLMPLDPVGQEDFMSRTERDLKSLFLLAKALEKDLRQSGGVLLAATRQGGTFGIGELSSGGFFAGNGAIAGFVKTVSREWPEVTSRVVDFEPNVGPELIAKLLVDELLCDDGVLEAGYVRGVRKTLRSQSSPLNAGPKPLALTCDSVVLVTGGARGITAGCALEIAKAYQPRFVLVGRSPLPPAEEPVDTAGITDSRQLKAVLMDRLQTGGQRVTPAVIEGALKRLKMDRDVRSNIAALCAAGSEVEYKRVDVSDAVAFGELIDQIYAERGRIDVVIHGAGVIEDKLLGDKTPESFDRVFRTKVESAWVLAQKLRPQELRLLAFFSSVSARYGNRGQSDYAAANEVLNKLALDLNARWPARVVSLNWGPWKSEGGMVSAELEARFAAAGVELIQPQGGYRTFLQELERGEKQDVEVVFGGPLNIDYQNGARPSGASPAHAAAERQAKTTNPVAFPMVSSLTELPTGSFEAVLHSHPARDRFLLDHQIDGKPVLPMACALEICMEAATLACKNGQPAAVRGLEVLQGIIYENGKGRELRLDISKPSASGQVDVLIRSQETGRIHYRGQVEFGKDHREPPARLVLLKPRSFPLSAAECYEQWLFHGSLFAGITEILAMGDNGIIAKLRPSRPGDLIESPPHHSWLVDPVVIDSALQLVWVWARAMFDHSALPASIEAYFHNAALPTNGEIMCEIEIVSKPGSPTLRCRPCFYDVSGDVLGWIEGLQFTMSKALNRVAAAKAGADAGL